MKDARFFSKIMSVVLAMAMVVSMLPMSVFATQTEIDVGTMSDEEVVALCVELAQADDTAALEAVGAQLEADEDTTRYARVEAMVMAELGVDGAEVAVISDEVATVTAYEQVDTHTDKQVELKYYEYVGTAADLEAAVTLLKNAGANGGLIEVSEGTLTVTNRQDITMANVVIKGAGEDTTVITGNATNFNNSTNGLANKSGLSSEYKAILGLHGENIKVMDLTVDGGACGHDFGLFKGGRADFKTVRINSGVSYLENVSIKGSKGKSNLMIGTSSTASVVYANSITVDKAYTIYGDTEVASGSSLSTINSYLGGTVVGEVETLGQGYYKLVYGGVTAYTTIPYAIETYNNGTFAELLDSVCTNEGIAQGVTVAEAMTADLTTVIDGTTTLLYGKDCDEMKALADEFKTALASLSDDTSVTVTDCLATLATALAVDSWHAVAEDGTCATCGTTGLEVPAEAPAVDVEISEEIEVDGAADAAEQTVVIDRVVTNNEAFKNGFTKTDEVDRLSVKATAMSVTDGVVTKMTFDVTPMLNGSEATLTESITFRLPVDANTEATTAAVFHEEELLGADYAIQGDANGKYVEVTSATFSLYTVDTEYEAVAAVAEVDGVEYATLAEAFAAADGKTVVLLDDLAIDAETYIIADGVSVTLNMNGKKLTVTDNKAANVCYELFYIYGVLTVTGNGTIELTSTSNDTAWAKSSSVFHNRGGVLTIENGTFTHKGGTAMAFVVDNSGNWYGDATTTIKDGTLTSSYIAIRNRMEQNSHGASGKAILNVSGGIISGTSRAIWAQAASTSETSPATGAINVSGGEVGLIDTPRSTGAVSMTTITGGTVASFKGEVGELTVTGGTITGDVTILTTDGEAAEYVVTADGLYAQAAAKIGETNYATLAEALTAAETGDTVTLLADVKLSNTLIIDTNEVTIDGANHEISLASSFTNTNSWGAAIMVGNSGYGDSNVAEHKVTIKNVVFDGITGNSLIRAQGVELVMDGCTVQNCDSTNTDQGMLRIDTTKATIQNCTFTNNKATKIIGNNHNTSRSAIGMTIDDCEFSENIISGPGVVVLSSDAGCAITDNEFVGNRVTCGNGATVYMGFTENNVVTGNLFKDNVVTGNASTNRIAGALFVGYTNEISGNAFVGNTATNAAAGGIAADSVCVDTYYDEEINLSENYWGGNEPDAVAIGGNTDVYVYNSYYTSYENGVLGGLTEVATPVAEVDGVKYTDLQAAIDAAANGAEIDIIADFALTAQDANALFKPAYNRASYCGVYIPDDKAIVLDLNGHTVSYVDEYDDCDNVMVLNLGNLTVNDSVGNGKLTYKPVAGSTTYSYFYSTIFNCGTLTVNGGTIENTAEAETDVTNAVDNHSRLSHEYGNDCILVVNGGTLSGAYYYAVRQYTHYFEGVKNRVTINDGTINGGIYMQHGDNWYYADPAANRLNVDLYLEINGGTIKENLTADSWGLIRARVSNPDNEAFGLAINGGTIKVAVDIQLRRGYCYDENNVLVQPEAGGARNDEWLEKNGGFITGGTFSALGTEGGTDDLSRYLTDGFELADNGDGTYGVQFADYIVLPEGVDASNYVEKFGDNTVTDGTNYYATLKDALAGIHLTDNRVLYCKPGADVGTMTHGHVCADLTVYGNGAYVSGGEQDFEVDTYTNTCTGLTADLTLTVKYLDGCGAWGQRTSANTVNLVFENCQDMNRVYITGTSGENNITLTDCSFLGSVQTNCTLYSNANGTITVDNVAFENICVPVNLNHKVAGTQTVVIEDCSFTNCGSAEYDYAAPIRVLSSVAGAETEMTVTGCTFTDTVANKQGQNADILLDYGVGTTTASVSATAANVVVETEDNVATTTEELTAEDTKDFTNVVATPVAEVDGVQYTDLQAAIDAAGEGGTVTLLRDVELTSMIFLQGGVDVTVEGAGKTITFVGDLKFGFAVKESTLTLGKDLNVVATGDTAPVYVQDGTVYTSANLTAKGEYAAIQGNGGCKGDVYIKDGTIITEKCIAIYWPQNGKLTISDGTISGPAGVEIRAGSLTMTGGTITATGGELKFADTENGSYVRGGVAVSLSQHTTKHPISINITGGTLNGTYAFYQSNATGDPSTEISASIGAEVILNGEVEAAEEGFEMPQAADGSYTLTAADYVAEVNGVQYTTLSAAFAAVTSDNDTVTILGDVTEELTGAYLRGNIVAEDDVTITLTNTDWVYLPYTFVVGENVTLKAPALFYYAGGSEIRGTVVTDAYYQRYAGTKLTIYEPGSMTVTGETCILRYMDGDAAAGIYVVGDNNDETVGLNLSVAYFYQGMINAKDADIKVGTYWQTNETDGEGTANLVLDNSNLTVTVSEHNMKATGNSTVTMTNGSTVSLAGGYEGVAVSMDETSSFTKNGATVMVAKIGTMHYATIQAAVDAAENGDTITLIDSVTQADGVLITDKNITVDLNGKTFTITEGASTNNRAFKINGSSVVTIMNGTIDAKGAMTSGAYGTVRTEGTANVTLTGLKLYSYRGYGLNVKACAGTTVTIKNTEIYAQYSGGVEASGGTIVLGEGTKIEQTGVYSTAAWCSVAIGVNGGGKVTVNGGTYSANTIAADSNAAQGTWVAYVMSSGGTLEINGGTFTGTVAETADAANACGIICADTKAVVNINGGTFTSNGAIVDVRNNSGEYPNPAITLAGGTFSADPRVSGLYGSDLITVAEGYEVVENTDGTYSVEAAVAYVAEVNGEKFTDLQAAENAANDGDTIVLLEDIELTKAVTFYNAAGARMVTLDMNGKTITLQNDYHVFYVCDGLTITGNGEIIAAPTEGYDWAHTFIVGHRKSGTTEGNAGNLIIENGYFYSNDATVVSVTNGSATILGGTFKSEGDLDLNCIDDMYDAGKASIVVKGGTFADFNPENNASEGVGTNFCADGFTCARNVDGTYSVGTLPEAEVKDLGKLTVDEYSVYNGSGLSDGGEPIDLTIAMEFVAKDGENTAGDNVFANYITDFYITMSGMSGNSFVADGCYLAGHYGDFGWVMIPLDGMTIENGKVYPVITSVGFEFTYEDICTSVKDFKCGIYVTPEVLETNPELTVNLTLALSEDVLTEEEAQNPDSFITVDEYDYDAEELKPVVYVAEINGVGYPTLADAFANAEDEDIITLLTDVELSEALTVAADKVIILELNGKTVAYTSTVQGEAMITNRGTLTIKDSVGTGVINYNYTGAADSSYGKGNYTISNGGTLTVNGGKITIANLRAHAKYPIDNNSTTGDAVLVINGGHLYNYNTSAIRQFCNSTTYQNSVTINGGLIEGYSAIWMQNPNDKTVNGQLTVTGGEIRTTAAAYVNGTSELKDVASKIYCTTEGGAWNESSAVTITGGTFNENVYLAENAPANITVNEAATFNGRLELPAAPEATMTLDGLNLRLQDLLRLGFYFTVETEETVEEVGALLWTAEEYAAETDFTVNSAVADNVAAQGTKKPNRYVVESEGIFAQYLDTVYYIIPYVVIDGEYVYGEAKSSSALVYANMAYNGTDENLKSIVVDLLNYATAARAYFCITENLPVPEVAFNSIIRENERIVNWDDSFKAEYPSVVESVGEYDPKFRSMRVNLNEAIKLHFIFEGSVSGVGYWTEEEYAALSVHNKENMARQANMTVDGKYRYGTLENLYSFHMYDNFYVMAYNEEGQCSRTYGSSVASYLTSLIDQYSAPETEADQTLVSLVKAMLVYGNNATDNPVINRGSN